MPVFNLGCLPCCHGTDGCCDLGPTLAATLTDKTGDATSLPDTMTFTQSGGVGSLTWPGNTIASPCSGGAPSTSFTLSCSSDVWTLTSVTGFGDGTVATLVSADCETLTVVFDVTFTGAGCPGGGGSFRITIQG